MLLPNFIKRRKQRNRFTQSKGPCLSAGEGRCCKSRCGEQFILESIIPELILAPGSGGEAATAADFTFPPTQRGRQVNSVKCLSVPLWTSSTHIDDPRGDTVLTK